MEHSVAGFKIIKNAEFFEQSHCFSAGHIFSSAVSLKAKYLEFKCFTHILHLRKNKISGAFILKKLGKHSSAILPYLTFFTLEK